MYYEHTVHKIWWKLHSLEAERGAAITADKNAPTDTLQYLRWFLNEFSRVFATAEATPSNIAKAGRWIGWILCQAETHRFWENLTSRDLIRKDREAGKDIAP